MTVRLAIVRRRISPIAVGVLVLASACSSSGSDERAVSVSVQEGRLPVGTGRLIGAEPVYSSAGARALVLRAAGDVLLAQSVRPNQLGAGPAEVLRSVDGGRTWRRIALPGPDGTGKRVLWAEHGRAAVMALEAIKPFNEGGTPVIRTSDDAGATWRLWEVPDPNDAGRYIQYGRWFKGRWIFYGNAEVGSGPAIYSAIWHSTDGQHLELGPVVLPGAVGKFTADGLTVVSGALIATGYNPNGGYTQTWRSIDGMHWTPLTGDARLLDGGALVRGEEVSLDGGRTWTDTSSVPGEGRLTSVSRVGGTRWFVQAVQTGEHTAVERLVRTDDGGDHFRLVALPPRPRRCRTSLAPDEDILPPRRVGSSSVVVSTCTPTEDADGSTGPPEVQIAISRDDGRTWSSVPVPRAARFGVPVAFTTRREGVSILVQDWAGRSARDTTHLLTLNLR